MVRSNNHSGAIPQHHVVHNSKGLVDHRLALIQENTSQCVEKPDSTMDFEKGDSSVVQVE